MKWEECLKKEKEILVLFDSGLSANMLRNHLIDNGFKVSYPMLCKLLRKNNRVMGNERAKIVFTKEQKKEILELYVNQKKSIAYIQKKLSMLTKKPISDFLKNSGIEITHRRNSRTQQIDENYFDTINSNYKAYILGFIIADACIIKNTNGNSSSLVFDLGSSDEYILKEFDNKLGGNGKVYYNKSKKTSVVNYGSMKLCDSLSKYGVVPRKTGKEYLPLELIDKKYISHLIRGFFDGDGTVFIRKDNSKLHNLRLEFGFCGNSEILQQVKNVLIDEIGISNNKIVVRKERNICQLMFSKYDDIVNFCHYIYKDADSYLIRKKERFKTFVSLYDNTEVTF